jgi:hypothetical protein
VGRSWGKINLFWWRIFYRSEDFRALNVGSGKTEPDRKKVKATSRTQCPRGLRRGFAAARLLECEFEYRWVHGCLSLVSFVCYQVEVSVMDRSLVQMSHNECGVSDCDRVTPTTRKPRNPGDVKPWKKKKYDLMWNVRIRHRRKEFDQGLNFFYSC